MSSRKTVRHTASRRTTRAKAHTVAYTPVKTHSGKPSGYAAGYKSGYEAGLAAASRQPANDDISARVTSRSSQSVQASDRSFQSHEDAVARTPAPEQATVEPTADRTVAQPALDRNSSQPIAGQMIGDRAAEGAPAVDRTFNSPAGTESTDTETPEIAPPTETASLQMDGAEMPRSLRGSLASLERQNMRTEADGLERIENEADLSSRIEHNLLVPLPASASLSVNPNLAENHRYCRPWTARFLADLARAHAAAFHRPIQVNSAVRTVEYQKRLMRTNGNAAQAEGDIVSPHLTGATIDIAKSGLTRQEIVWMRRQLMGLQQAGKIDVEEEFEQACFHITVYKSYAPSKSVHKAGQPATGPGTNGQRKASQPGARPPAGHLPADLAVGVFPAQGR
ncbi:MAG TPA: DUF5715 family protein [Terracidiphilus sp.]|nr:DUF5715 family protein [Terracidiphilus sp.]